jgi:hypothetical protein
MKTVLQKIQEVLSDGEPRTVRRVAYLAEVSLNAVRQAIRNKDLVKVGVEPKPCPLARCGQAIVSLPKAEKRKRCIKTSTPMAA